MAAPMFFVALTLPLSHHKKMLAIPAAIFLALHLGFGVQRLIAATDETGIRSVYGGYPQYPFWRSGLLGCEHVAIDMKDPHVERAAETVLNDLGISYDFSTDRKSNFAFGDIVPATVRPNVSDCTISSQLLPSTINQA
jgi:hypothetical protein